jgi:hypothetical protein
VRSFPFLAIVCAAFNAAAAQAQEGLAIRAARRDTVTAAATVTATFTIGSQRAESILVTPRVEAPADWTVLVGGAAIVLPPGSSEMLILSVAVPARAAAGVYPIRVRLGTPTDSNGVADSVVVRVPARYALEVGVIDRPGFIVSGRTYDAGFLLRNRGNKASGVRVSARSSLGVVAMMDTVIQLAADESRVLRARVSTPAKLETASDDVLEITATQFGDSLEKRQASVRVTIVPEPSRKIEEYLRIPTRVHVRAASTDGVSPFEILGHGLVRDGSATRVDFLMRGPTGHFSAFGERDEYRVNLTAKTWSAQLGDQFFMLTPLTGGAQPGLGLGADRTMGALSFGGYGQQFRRAPEGGSELAAFVAAEPADDARVAVNLVNRSGGGLPARIGSASASAGRAGYRGEAELARSSAAGGTGNAHSARLSGASSGYSFDFGHTFADTAFAGTSRGSTHDYFTANAQQFEHVSFALNGGRHLTDLSRSTGVPYTERLDAGLLAATFFDRVTLELSGFARATEVQGISTEGRQRGVRARADQPTRFGALSLEAEAGRAREGSAPSRPFTSFSLGARRSFERGTIGMTAERYDGGAITQGAEGTMTLSGDASIRLRRNTSVSMSGYATRVRQQSTQLHSQLDAFVTHSLPNGRTLTLRARLLAGGVYPRSDQNVAYLEYGIPLRLPVSRLRTPGRVYGRVVDAATGNGVAGALVRLGPQVAITDTRGEVAFGGVPGGEHRLSMSQETSFSDAVFVGDPTLRVDSTRTEPTMFRLAIARSARLDIDVRRFMVARKGIGEATDSLTDAGPLENAMLMLVGERDTLYRTTTESGRISFTDIPPGAWVVSIRGDAPAFHRFEPDRIEVQLTPGETKTLGFRLVPRRREVQIIGGAQELRPTTADPKTTNAPGGTRTIKPNQQQQKNQD